MAHQQPLSANTLRAVTYRLTSTPQEQLPKVASQATGAIWNCKQILSSPSDSKSNNNDASTIVHRFKTQLSTLLQDRSVEGRWSAVVLVKATIEAGGLEVLAKSNGWARSLLGILKKPDPPSTRTLAVLTLTRIFMLTWDHSNLVREITTPALTAFVPTCITNMEHRRCSSQELQTILEAFTTLLPRHPTIFRTHEAKLRASLATILSSRSNGLDSAVHYSCEHIAAARKVLVLLYGCAPKQGASEKWEQIVRAAVLAAHSTCDRVFRAVHEEWETVTGIEPSLPQHIFGELELASDDQAGMKPWKGVYAGSERLLALLGLICSHLETTTQSTVSLRIGLITDLLVRILLVQAPSLRKQNLLKLNNQITKDEREALFTVLPEIHEAGMQVASTIIERFGAAAFAMTHSLTEQTLGVFYPQDSPLSIRLALYKLLYGIIENTGPSLKRNDFTEISHVLKYCCEEALFIAAGSGSGSSNTGGTASGIKQQLGLDGSDTQSTNPADMSEVNKAALRLLRVTLAKIDAAIIPPKLRAQIDRTVVLANDKEAIMASVMNPPHKRNREQIQASLMPILARNFHQAPLVEAMLRPRMPPISTGHKTVTADDSDSLDEDLDEESGSLELNEQLAEPADDLLSVVEEASMPEQARESEDMNMVDAEPGADTVSNGKRRAFGDVESTPSTKRLRASPDVGSLMQQSEAMATLDSFSLTVDAEQARNDTGGLSDSISEPVAITAAVAPGMESSRDAADGGSDDDSDFEYPPLTMDPDTDPEDVG